MPTPVQDRVFVRILPRPRVSRGRLVPGHRRVTGEGTGCGYGYGFGIEHFGHGYGVGAYYGFNAIFTQLNERTT